MNAKKTNKNEIKGLRPTFMIIDEVHQMPEISDKLVTKRPYVMAPHLTTKAFKNNPELRELKKQLDNRRKK